MYIDDIVSDLIYILSIQLTYFAFWVCYSMSGKMSSKARTSLSLTLLILGEIMPTCAYADSICLYSQYEVCIAWTIFVCFVSHHQCVCLCVFACHSYVAFLHDIADNSLTGSIPSELGDLQVMSVLHLGKQRYW